MRPLLAVVLLILAPAQSEEHPRAVSLRARLAVEGDSTAPVGAAWQERLSRDSTDRAALLGLAVMARLGHDDSTAVRYYRRLLALSEPRADLYAVYGRLGIARIRYEAVDMETTDSIVQLALANARALRDSASEGDALQALGNARVDAHKAVGLAYLDSALRVLPASESALIAGIRCRRGIFLFYMGDARAWPTLVSALDYSRQVKAPRGEAQCLRAMARELWGRGLEDSSIAMIRRANDILRRVRDHRSLAFGLTTLADVLRDHGAYGEAKEALSQSLAEARASGYQEAEALAKHMLGTLYYSLHDLPTASSWFDQAMAQYVAMDDSADQVNVRSWQANIARDRGDLATARRLTQAALDFDQQSGSMVGVIELYVALADIEILAGNWSAAAAALDSSDQVLRRNRIATWRPKVVYQRGRLALHRGDLDGAERIFRNYLRELGADQRLRQHETRAYIAEILARRGDLAGAERELTAAGDALDAWRAGLDDQQLRLMAFQATASDESDRNSSVPRVIAALAAGGRARAAFGLAEGRRARELSRRLYEASALETSPAGAAGRPAPAAPAMSTDELAGLLPDDSTALVEYVTGALGAPTTAFVVTRRAGLVRAEVLPPADSLTGAIGRLIALVAKGESTPPEASTLAETLLGVVGSLDARVTRLIIVPDGPLHRVPWDALRLSDGRYAVERYAISVAPSAATFALLRHRPARPFAPARVLAFGDPVFPADSATPFADGELPRLAASGREAKLVAGYAATADVRLRDRATAEYLRYAALDSFSVIHLATHALVDDRALGRTALALSAGTSADGFVTPGELAALELDADMVVLSACRTAGGVVVDGEGVQGLTAPLLQAGARSVVATSWRVGDRSTVRFVEQFYDQLATGKPVAEALRAAKLAALKEGAKPGVWAAFSVVGDPTVRIALRRPKPVAAWWAGAGGLGVVIAAAIAARRRRSAAGDPQLAKR